MIECKGLHEMIVFENQHELAFPLEQVFETSTKSEIWQRNNARPNELGISVACEDERIALGTRLIFGLSVPILSTQVETEVIDFKHTEIITIKGECRDAALTLNFNFSSICDAMTKIHFTAEAKPRSMRARVSERAIQAVVKSERCTSFSTDLINQLAEACAEDMRLSA